MDFSRDIAQWLYRAEQRLSAYEIVHRQCGKTPLSFRVGETNIVRWVERFLTPMLDRNCESIEDHPAPALHFDHLYDDALVEDITRKFIEHDQCEIDDDIGPRGGYRYEYDEGKSVLLDPSEGIAFHLDLPNRHFHFVHSSRTRWSSIQFGDMVYEPLLRSAQRNGGVVFHAGAVSTNRGAILIVGYGGNGKTTLVGSLMRAGGAFLANERSFVKQTDSGFNVFCFPDWINIGLGTVLQQPGMARLLPFPDNISLPQRRISYSKVRERERSKWSKMSEKIALLCDEFSSFLGAPRPQSGAPIVGIIRPKVSFQPIDASLSPIEKSDAYRLLDENVLGLSSYPDWMRWNVPDAEPNIEALSQLPTLRLRFYVGEDGRIQGMENALDAIFDAFDRERNSESNQMSHAVAD